MLEDKSISLQYLLEERINTYQTMKFCREIDKYNRIFYDPVSNQFLINGEEPILVNEIMEAKILEVVEQAEAAGFSQDEILHTVSGLLI